MLNQFPFDTFPRLETPRLVLRQITSEDTEDVFAIFANKQVVKFYDLPLFTELDQAVRLIERQQERFQLEQAIRWGIAQKTDNRIIGTCGLFLKPSYRAEIGYDLAQKYWRRGFMRETLTAVLQFAFEEIELNRIEAYVMPGNIASLALLKKLGFQKEGILREYAFFKGQFHDLVSFSKLQQDHIG